MSATTEDPDDPRLGWGSDKDKRAQSEAYLVLPKAEREKQYVRPLRKTYTHKACGKDTTMADPIAETYARDPKFYGSTYCCHCAMHRPVSEFVWTGTKDVVGS